MIILRNNIKDLLNKLKGDNVQNLKAEIWNGLLKELGNKGFITNEVAGGFVTGARENY